MSGDFSTLDELFESDPYDPQVAELRERKISEVTDAVETRKLAFLEGRRLAYVATLIHGNATPEQRKRVVDDIKRFARGDNTVFHENDRIHALLTGRQEVFVRINDHLTMTLDQLVDKYDPPKQ